VKALQEGEKMAFHRIKPWIGILFRTGINLFCVYVAMLLAVGAASSSFFSVRVMRIFPALLIAEILFAPSPYIHRILFAMNWIGSIDYFGEKNQCLMR
jgi:hypothetical protein